jgi:hypothetical protein
VDDFNAELLAQLDALAKLDLSKGILAGATLLRNVSYGYYLDIDPDAPESEFTAENTEINQAKVTAQEEFDITQLEFGSGFSAGRPFMRPAIDDSQDAIVQAVGEEVQSIIKGAI